MKVIITKELEPIWAAAEDYRQMRDGDLLELVSEDFVALLEGATFEFVREENEKFDGS